MVADTRVGVTPLLFKLLAGFFATYALLVKVVLEDTDVSLPPLFGFDADLLL